MIGEPCPETTPSGFCCRVCSLAFPIPAGAWKWRPLLPHRRGAFVLRPFFFRRVASGVVGKNVHPQIDGALGVGLAEKLKDELVARIGSAPLDVFQELREVAKKLAVEAVANTNGELILGGFVGFVCFHYEVKVRRGVDIVNRFFKDFCHFFKPTKSTTCAFLQKK
jgi:hypothetical protein